MTNYTNLTEDENFALTHITRWGSDGYPLRKMSGKWFVTGIRGCGSFPTAFKTKREAAARFELYYSLLVDRAAGRIS